MSKPDPDHYDARIRHFDKGQLLYAAGERGHAWRVVSGAVRLNDFAEDDVRFAGLAVAGNVIGLETLAEGRYGFEASALATCLIEPWQPVDETELRGMLAATTRQAADLLALRAGSAEARVRRLITRLAEGRGRYADMSSIALPSQRNIADITGLTNETVSRIISRWREQGCDVAGRSRMGLRMAWPLRSACLAPKERSAS
jgi:CRP-like cAMP-binding protein